MLDWFWIGTHSYTLTSFIKPKPLALLHCHWFHDIHHANTSPTYYIILDIICQENMTLPVIMVTASLLTGNGRSARLLYLLTFSSLRQVGGWEPGSSQDVTLPLIPDEDRETNTCMLYERILLEASQSVGSNPKVTRTLCRWHQVGDWEWETQYVCVSHNANGQNIIFMLAGAL